MNRPFLLGAAASALYLSACMQPYSQAPPEIDPPPGTTTGGPAKPSPGGTPCSVDADCGLGNFCELRICIPGCLTDDECDAAASCDPHGRCTGTPAPGPTLATPPTLHERRTLLSFGEHEARTRLTNDGPEPLHYRLSAISKALTFDNEPATLAPGEEVELLVTLDLAALTPADRVLPIQLLTDGGALLWSIELEGPPASGQFAGSVLTGEDILSLGSDRLLLDLDFQPDGTIFGKLDPRASLTWPQAFITGTWTPAGDVTMELRTLTSAGLWQVSPIARPLGRVLTLAGKHTAAGLAGTATLAITGMRDDPVELAGTFMLRPHSPLAAPVDPPPSLPGDAKPPTWLAPPDLDKSACTGLGEDYGTPATLPAPSPACSACADASCSPEEMLECAGALWSAAYHLPDVLDGLAGTGEVTPPGGPWDWADCTADKPTYTNGTTCYDPAAISCAVALLRRGAPEIADPWGEAFRMLAAVYATSQADAAMLLSSEAEIDAAFAFKNSLGESAAGAIARELEHLRAARLLVAAALAPMLTTAFAADLTAAADSNPDLPLDNAQLAPLRLLGRFAELTAAWTTAAHRAGIELAALRATVREAAITVQAGALYLRAALPQDLEDEAELEFMSLETAMQALSSTYAALIDGTSPFGVPEAYVPLMLGPEDIAQGRTNFEAVLALAQDDVGRYGELTDAAWDAMREYEEKTHALDTTALQLEATYDGKLRGLCGSEPGKTTPALATCGQQGGRIAELRAGVEASSLRIRHAAQAVENNLHGIAVEEERFGKEVALALNLQAEIDAAHGQIFKVQDKAGKERSTLAQAEAAAECSRVRENADAEADVLQADCLSQIAGNLFSGPTIFGVPTPNPVGLATAGMSCIANTESLAVRTENQCESILGQAGLESAREELARSEEQAIMAINAEIDAKIRASDLESKRAASVALIKNLRAEGLLLQIEVEEAQLARRTATTAMWSAYQEVGALAQEKARALGLMLADNPDNTRTRPHFLEARREAASRVFPVRELTMRRVYLALRALEYELGQELPILRADLLTARSPDDFAALLSCLDTIAEDYKLTFGHGQPYITEVSLRSDVFGITDDIADIDGTPASPAEQFQALLLDPLHRQPDGAVALPFALTAFENTLLSTWLCDDRLEKIEVKFVGDYLGDREAEVILTRQGLAGVRRCDSAELPPWSSYIPYSFDREQIIIQAGVNEWGTAGPNAGYAAWPVHGEQWTLTIPPAKQSPANADLELRALSDVVLRLYHRAGTLAPAGQGVFTPSCGGSP